MTENKNTMDTAKEPNFVDAVICDKMEALDDSIALHRQLRTQLGEDSVPPYFPAELITSLDFDSVDRAWDQQDYDLVRQEYVKLWMAHYGEKFGMAPAHSLAEFLDGTAQDNLV